jgi:hypothetical protein
MPTRQRGQSLHLDNLQETLDASPDTIRKGTQQFETPLEWAEALCVPLTQYRPTICDFNCGGGSLLKAARNSTTKNLLGIDIDPRSRNSDFTTIIGDLNAIYPLMGQVSTQFDMLVLNPPFSLRWPEVVGEPDIKRGMVMGRKPPVPGRMIDSTLATYRMAVEALTVQGEGMMICNLATAKRLIGDDEHIWLRLDLPNFFPGTDADMRVGVLYFLKQGRAEPLAPPEELTLNTVTPESLASILKPYCFRGELWSGQRVKSDWVADINTIPRFDMARSEWLRLENEKKGRIEWNIKLTTDGTIYRYLTPFERFSSQRVPADLVDELDTLKGKNPMELVVQRNTRVALMRAVESGIWRVQPELITAVREAVREYNSVRAPFVHLNEIQRLGYLDENDSILCNRSYSAFVAGAYYQLSTVTFIGFKKEQRKRIDRTPEWVEVTGQELLIKIGDTMGNAHGFTQFPMTKEQMAEHGVQTNHTLQILVDNFLIPEVSDVSITDPEQYSAHRTALLALQTQ